MMRLNVAIDGPVSAGKSSVSDAVAKRLGILHLDTGAMYRALGLAATRAGIDTGNEKEVVEFCRNLRVAVSHEADGQHTFLEGEDVTGLIRTPEVSMAASTVSTTAKIYLTAAQEERARRRYAEMKEKGQEEPFEKVLEDLKARDEQDMNREVEPLRQAPDAELVDSTHLTFDETVEAIVRIVEAKRNG